MRAVWLVVLCLWLSGCTGDGVQLGLLNVVEVSPKRFEVGDELEIVGLGFPQGRPASVTFSGSISRRSQPVLGNVSVTLPASVSSARSVELLMDEKSFDKLWRGGAAAFQPGTKATHLTFHGDVLITFAPYERSALPVTGRLSGVKLDGFVPDSEAEQKAAEKRGSRLAEFAGMQLVPELVGFRIAELAPGGRAAQAGLLEGDLLLAFDGLDLHSLADLVPSDDRQQSSVLVKRGRIREAFEVPLEIQGFAPKVPGRLLIGAVLVGVFALILAFLSSPLFRLFFWWETRAAERLRAASSGSGSGLGARVRASLATMLKECAGFRGLSPVLSPLPYLLFIGTSAAFTVLCFERSLVAAELDLVLLYASALSALVATALFWGGRQKGGFSLWSGLKSSAFVLCVQLPGSLALLLVFVSAGSLSPAEVVSAQGGLPWSWHAFQNPFLFLSFIALLSGLIPDAALSRGSLPEADADAFERPSALRGLVVLAQWQIVFVMCGLSAALFLGGWQLPSVPEPVQASSLRLQALGAVLFQAKCWMLVLFVLFLRWVLGSVRVDQVVGVYLRFLVPLSLAALGLTFLLQRTLGAQEVFGLAALQGPVLFGFWLLLLARFVLRAVQAPRPARGALSVNPWL